MINMKRSFLYLTAIAFVTSLSLSMMSCSSDDPNLDPDDSGITNDNPNGNDDPKEVEKTLNSIATEWGMSFEQVKNHMDGYTLVRSGNEFLMYSDKGGKHYYSYKFADDSLCSSLLLMPQLAEDIDLSDILKGLSYVGELDNTQVYHNNSKNVLACTYEADKNNSKYQAIGFTPIFPTADSFFGEENGHEYVDLGLSVKWATCNIGASKPEEYGGYYAWGETETKYNYYWTDYAYGNDENNCQNIGNDIAGTKYDVAHVKWGGSWCMPSEKQFQELADNCRWIWTVRNGVNGHFVTGPNGASIFLPAAGHRWFEKLIDTNEGLYWSSSLFSDKEGKASYFYFSLAIHESGTFDRCAGFSVRAVCP